MIHLSGQGKLKNLNGIKCTSATSINVADCGLTSFEGLPKDVYHLSMLCKNSLISFDGFPDRIVTLDIIPFKGSLMVIHEKFHDKHVIDDVYFWTSPISEADELTEAFNELSDPFEFQDWCIDSGYEEYL
jgi:hypothetical protein